MTGRPRLAIAAMPGYTPGRSAAAAAADHGVLDAVKLASNELPYGPLPSVARAIADGAGHVERYPDHRATALREALAARLGLGVDHVTVGAGSAGILQQLFLAYVGIGQQVAMCWPSFEAYPMFAGLVEADEVRVPLRDEAFDLPSLAAAITADTKLAFVTNPNNPTGTVVGTDEIIAFLDAVPGTCLVVLDEAYDEFVTDPRVRDSIPLIERYSNLIVARTFSKAHGLAGLRVGYAAGDPEVISIVDRTLVPFAVNELAQVAALASLAATDEMAARVASVVAERDRVAAALRATGWDVPEPQGNFVWLPAGEAAAELGVGLERRGIVARAFAGVGVRVTTGDPAANERFLAAFAEAVGEVDTGGWRPASPADATGGAQHHGV